MNHEEITEKFKIILAALEDIDDLQQTIITDKQVSYDIYDDITSLVFKISKAANDQGVLICDDDV